MGRFWVGKVIESFMKSCKKTAATYLSDFPECEGAHPADLVDPDQRHFTRRKRAPQGQEPQPCPSTAGSLGRIAYFLTSEVS